MTTLYVTAGFWIIRLMNCKLHQCKMVLCSVMINVQDHHEIRLQSAASCCFAGGSLELQAQSVTISVQTRWVAHILPAPSVSVTGRVPTANRRGLKLYMADGICLFKHECYFSKLCDKFLRYWAILVHHSGIFFLSWSSLC